MTRAAWRLLGKVIPLHVQLVKKDLEAEAKHAGGESGRERRKTREAVYFSFYF